MSDMDSQSDAPQPSESSESASHPTSQEVRLRTLRSLMGASSTTTAMAPSSQSETRSASARPRRPTFALIAVSSVTVVVVFAVVLASLLHTGALASLFPTQRHAAPVVTFFPELSAGLECPHDASWSPDGQRLAIVGYQRACISAPTWMTNPYESSMLTPAQSTVVIYDAKTGKSISTLQPDAMILHHITLPAAVTTLLGNPQINSGPLLSFNYTHVLWSRDGKQIALTFTGYIPTGLPVSHPDNTATWPGYQVDGVLTLGESGANPQVYLHPFDPTHPLYTEWDLSSGSVITSTLPSPSRFSTIQPAARYQWGPDGAITIADPFTASGMFGAPAGSTNGGGSFALWQPGYAIPMSSATPGGSASGYNGFFTDIAAWSPDGRYLIEHATVEALVTSTSTATNATPTNWQDAPAIPSISAGFVQAYERFGASNDFTSALFLTAQQPILMGFPIAWSPKGDLVAAYSPAHGSVMVFNAKSGVRVRTFAAVTNLNYTPSDNSDQPAALRWSPDGSRLLLFDPMKGTATIFPVS